MSDVPGGTGDDDDDDEFSQKLFRHEVFSQEGDRRPGRVGCVFCQFIFGDKDNGFVTSGSF